MSGGGPPPERDEGEEFSTLIKALRDTDQRLEDLTSGEIDTVADREGRSFLLHRAQDRYRDSEAARQVAILNALPALVALLDARGVIISVNAAWRRFAVENRFAGVDGGIGLDYLAVCGSAMGVDAADYERIAVGVRAVLTDDAPSFSLEYSRDSPTTAERWYLLTVTPLDDTQRRGVIVMHLDVTLRRRDEDALRRFVVAMDTISDEIYLVDRSTMRYIHVNDAACRVRNRSREELLALGPEEVDSDSRVALIRTYDLIIASGAEAKPIELPRQRRDGTRGWIELRRHPQCIGERWTIVTMVRDITERKETEARIAYLSRVYAMLSGMNSLIVRARRRDVLYQEACRVAVEEGGFLLALIIVMEPEGVEVVPVAMAGKSEALVAATRARLAAKHAAPTALVLQALQQKKAMVSNDTQSDPMVEFADTHVEFGLHSMAVLPLIVSNRAIGVVALYAGERQFFQDDEMMLLTELVGDIAFAVDHIDKDEKLNYLAFYDVLTGLANRSLFLERVGLYLRSAAAEGRRVSVFLLDLQRFRNINDSLGRAADDALLRLVAEWFTRIVGDANLLARVAGDQFAVVLPETSQNDEISEFLERTMVAFQHHPFRLNDAVLRMDAKVGAAMFPDDGDSADVLYRNAEGALKRAKSGGDRYLRYTRQMNDSIASTLSLENQLRQALDEDQFVLHYQPKVNLASGKLCGAEALIRWNDPRTGLAPPGRFIAVLEETGLIHDVGRWALLTAIADYRRWCRAGLSEARIAVNVSTLQLRARDFTGELQRLIGVEGDIAAGLELEITEGIIMEDVKHSITTLHAIRALGVRVAIDDFGTGFSSLSYLSKLPVDTLKIDRSFVIEMAVSPEGLALVSTIINLAHALKLCVVAEGVETEEQARLLRLLNCDEAQGYLFSRPLPAAQFEATYIGSCTPA